MALIDLAREKTRDELRALAQDIRDDEVPGDLRDELESLIRQASDDEQARAFDENGAIADIMAALDLRPPPTGLEEPDVPEGADVEVEVDEGPPDEVLEGVPTQPRGGGERPDPRFGRTTPERLSGTDLERAFPQPNVREEFKRLETARLNIGEDAPSPGEFFDQFAQQVLGQNFIITRQEFIDAQQSPGTTGLFN